MAHPLIIACCAVGGVALVGSSSVARTSTPVPAIRDAGRSRERWAKETSDDAILDLLRQGERDPDRIVALTMARVYPGAPLTDPIVARMTLRAMRHLMAVLDEEAEDAWYAEGGR